MRYVLTALTALLMTPLSACAVPNVSDPATAGSIGSVLDASGAVAPAPLAHTVLDDKALIVALQSADMIATSVDALVLAKVIVPGTPRALSVQVALRRLRNLLSAASAAQKAGSALSYQQALTDAAIAVKDVTTLIRQR